VGLTFLHDSIMIWMTNWTVLRMINLTRHGILLNYVSGELAELPLGWNDEISSITVPAGYLLIVYEHAFFGGSTRVIQNSWTVNDSQDWWNDRISSFKLIRI